MALTRCPSPSWQRSCADQLVGRPRTGHRNRGLENNMKKTISALVAVALLSLGVAFAQTTTTQTGPKTTTNPVTGATTEKSEKTTVAPTSTGTPTTKKNKKATKKSGATKSTTTKSEAETASTPVPATK